MATTGFARSFAVAPWFQPPEFSRPAASNDWEVIATAIVPRPTDDPNWHFTCVLTATVDRGATGELRVITGPGNVSPTARIVSHVGPIHFGWTPITTWSPEFEIPIFLQGRRVVGSGGGVRVHKAALSLESAPSPLGIAYPSGYDPGTSAPYPPNYVVEPYS